jgi:hypothetical protein
MMLVILNIESNKNPNRPKLVGVADMDGTVRNGGGGGGPLSF